MLDHLLENIVSEKGGGVGSDMDVSCTARCAESEEQHSHLVVEKQHTDYNTGWDQPTTLV